MTETIESTAVDVISDQQRVQNVPAVIPPVPPQIALVPQVTPEDLVARLAVIQQAADNAMTENVDYGKIPGTDKPTLLKPGAEKLGVLFQLDVQFVNERIWGPGDHLTVVSHVTVFHALTGARLGAGEGACSTREKKYGKRHAKRACPNCGAEQINKSKFPPRDNPDAEPGWYCHAKFGGCGAQFDATDPRITGQTVGDVENPDLPDMWNTVLKMAKKRAQIDAVLAVTGASAIFTQDIEDQSPPDDPPPAPPKSAPPAAPLRTPEQDLQARALQDLVDVKAAARMPDTEEAHAWVRAQFKAVGVDLGEKGPTMQTLRALNPDQVFALTDVFRQIVDRRANAKAAEGAVA